MKTLDIILISSIGLSNLNCMKCDIKPEIMFPEIYTQHDEKSDKNYGPCFKPYVFKDKDNEDCGENNYIK